MRKMKIIKKMMTMKKNLKTNKDVIDFDVIKKVARDVGDDITDEQIRKMMERCSQNGKEMTFEEFYDVLTKKVNM